MYELGIVLFFTGYSYFKLIEEGIHYPIIIISLMVHMLAFITLQLRYHYNRNNGVFLVYGGCLLVGSFFIHPILGVLGSLIVILKYPDKVYYTVAIILVSLINYKVYYEQITYTVIWLHSGILVGGYYLNQLVIKIRSLESQIDHLRDATKEYQYKVNQLHIHNEQLEYTTKLVERNQIAQVLHDKLGHTLAGNIMRLEVVKLLVDTKPDQAKYMLDEIIRDLRDGMDQIRGVLKELKPAQSEVGIHTIKEMLQELEGDMPIRTHLYQEGNLLQIPFILWKVIIDNLLEAITNLKKYSNASQFDVDIYQFNQILKVEIKDNGRIDQVLHKGLGLRGMEERVIETGGEIKYNLDDGFSILMIWVRKDDKDINCR